MEANLSAPVSEHLESATLPHSINKNLCTSLLFIVPVIYAYLILPPYSSLMIGSTACLITSVVNHYYKSQNKLFRIIDFAVVVPIAAYFTLHCYFMIGFKFYAIMVYICALISLCAYYYINYCITCDYHCLVHICAVIGIMLNIKSVKTYLLTEEVTLEDKKIEIS